MANKKDYTIEELQKLYEDAKKNFETIGEQLTIAKKEEEDRKKAELALKKETRKKEVDDAITNAKNLLEAYIKDYGKYSSEYDSNTLNPLFKSLSSWWFQ